MKVCVSYSDSHEVFLKDWFLKSFPYEVGCDLVIRKVPQVCSSGRLFSEGWRDQMIEKQIFLNESISNSKDGEIILFSDVDINFYGPFVNDLKSLIKGNDILFMKDHNSDLTGRCGGFFCFMVTYKTRGFFEKVLERLRSHKNQKVTFQTSEQSTINNLLRENSDIQWDYLPPRYYTHGLYTQGLKNFSDKNQAGLWWENKTYEEKINTHVPDDILVHHANWCHGIGVKKDVLSFIKQKINYRREKQKRFKPPYPRMGGG